MSESFTLEPYGPYSLEASARFLEGFWPAAHRPSADGHLHLAFVPAGEEAATGVCLRTGAHGAVVGDVFGRAEHARVREQVRRILSLDVDASAWGQVGERDPVIGRLQGRFPGLRPVSFLSPYEAGAWALMSHRVRMAQAARLKARMTDELGERVEIHGEPARAFPAPGRLARIEGFSGLSTRKLENLRALAGAALDGGTLEAERLRSVPAADALDSLQKLPGIGPFSAELILLRGAGAPDVLPTAEPRLRRAVALAYDRSEQPGPEELETLSEAWRPYRTWAAFLLRVNLGTA